MADATYTVKYDASSAIKAAQDIELYTKAVLGLVAANEAYTKSKISFAGAGTSAKSATPKIEALTASVKELSVAGKDASTSLNLTGASMKTTTSSSKGLALGITAVGIASKLISESVNFVQRFNEAMEEARDSAHQAADEVGKVRDETRELKTLLDGSATDDEAMLSTLQLSASTGSTVTKAAAFHTAYEGADDRGVDKGNITPEITGQLKAETLRTARRLGIDETVMGQFAGGLSGYGKVDSKEQAMNQIGGTLWGLQKGKSSYTALLKAYNKLAPQMVGDGKGFADSAEAGITLGAVDSITGTADSAQMAIIQANRLLSTTKGDAGKNLAKFGIKAGMDFVEKLEKLAPHIQGVDADRKLQDLGFTESPKQREVVRAMMSEIPVMKKRLAEKRGKDFGAEGIASNEDYQKNDKAAARSTVKAQLAASKLIKGMRAEVWDTALMAAESEMILNNQLDTVKTKAEDKNLAALTFRSEASVRSTRVRHRVLASIQQAFESIGVNEKDFEARYKGIYGTHEGSTPEIQAQQYGRAVKDFEWLTDASANPNQGKAVADELKRLREVNEEQLAEMKRNNRGGGRPPAVPGAVQPGRK